MEFDLSGAFGCNPTIASSLCEIMGRHGSDKGNARNTAQHNYTIFYEKLFLPMKEKPLRLFELGLGTNNTDVPSNMGPNGKPGASHRGWREFFPNAQIFGADIDSRVLFQEDRISTFYCDQTSPTSINELWSNDALCEPYDIIVEDGLHEYNANVCFFENSFHMLKSGGVYIIEDIKYNAINAYAESINTWTIRYPGSKFDLLVLPHIYNRSDNILMVVRKA